MGEVDDSQARGRSTPDVLLGASAELCQGRVVQIVASGPSIALSRRGVASSIPAFGVFYGLGVRRSAAMRREVVRAAGAFDGARAAVEPRPLPILSG